MFLRLSVTPGVHICVSLVNPVFPGLSSPEFASFQVAHDTHVGTWRLCVFGTPRVPGDTPVGCCSCLLVPQGGPVPSGPCCLLLLMCELLRHLKTVFGPSGRRPRVCPGPCRGPRGPCARRFSGDPFWVEKGPHTRSPQPEAVLLGVTWPQILRLYDYFCEETDFLLNDKPEARTVTLCIFSFQMSLLGHTPVGFLLGACPCPFMAEQL